MHLPSIDSYIYLPFMESLVCKNTKKNISEAELEKEYNSRRDSYSQVVSYLNKFIINRKMDGFYSDIHIYDYRDLVNDAFMLRAAGISPVIDWLYLLRNDKRRLPEILPVASTNLIDYENHPEDPDPNDEILTLYQFGKRILSDDDSFLDYMKDKNVPNFNPSRMRIDIKSVPILKKVVLRFEFAPSAEFYKSQRKIKGVF